MVRIVCLSDTHSRHEQITVPDGDILIHAGDATMVGDIDEIADFDHWLGTLPHQHKHIIAGNHDWLFQTHPHLARSLITNAVYLQDSFLVFASLVGVGFYFRRRVDVHKRLMLLATISILPAATARLPFAFIQQVGPLAFFGLADLFIVPCLLYDLGARGHLHRATVWGGLVIVVSHPLRLLTGNTQAWLAFAT